MRVGVRGGPGGGGRGHADGAGGLQRARRRAVRADAAHGRPPDPAGTGRRDRLGTTRVQRNPDFTSTQFWTQYRQKVP